MIHQLKDYVGASMTCTINCNLNTTQNTGTSPVYLQIWNKDLSQWDTLLQNDSALVNVDFTMTVSGLDVTSYKDSGGIITCRIYQEAK